MKQYPVNTVTLKNGESLAYREAGNSDKTVLLIHGNMSSSVHWQTTMEALEGGYHIVAPDMRGFGDSTYFSRFDSLSELAQDLEEFTDLVGLENFAAVGWSTGGGVALEMAADMPSRVEKTILLDSVPPTGYPIFKKDALGQPVLTELLKTKEEIETDSVQVAPVLYAYANNDREMMRGIWNAVIYNMVEPPAKDYEEYLTAMLKQRNLVDIDYALLTFNMTDTPTLSSIGSGRLKDIKCPVVILHGEKDLVVPFAWGQSTHALIPGSELVVFDFAGHSAITDDPQKFFAALRKALV